MPSNSNNNSRNGGGRGGSNSNRSNNSGGSNNRAQQPISDYEFLKPWGGMENFMLSHGLRMWNPEDVDEAHQIIDIMRQQAGLGRSPYRS